MEAYYYQIKHKIDGEIVDEGLIRHSEDRIYPQQKTGIDELPFECECHHFKAENYILDGWTIELNRSDVRRFRSS